MKEIALFLNGEAPAEKPDLKGYKKVFCTDGAFHYLQRYGIKPDVVSGDFDSLESLPPEIERIPTPDQEYTDFEKALCIIREAGYKQVEVYGASGKEQDHFLGNLTVGYKFQNALALRFIDNYQTYYFTQKHTELQGVKGKTISLYPFPTASGIVTKGLAYPLSGEDLSWKSRIGTRNQASDDRVQITYEAGSLLLFIQR